MTLYFGTKIDRASLTAEKVGKIVRIAFIVVAGIFAVVGISAVVVEVWPNPARLFSHPYWLFATPGKFWFALSLFADLYLVMRVLRKGERMEKVRWPRPDGARDGKIKVDVSRALAVDVQKDIRYAYKLAARLKYAEVMLVHLMIALLNSPAVSSLLVRLEIDSTGMQDRLKHLLGQEHKSVDEPIFGESTKQIFVKAYTYAQSSRSEDVGAHQVLNQVVLADERIKEIFFDLGIDEQKLRNSIRWLEINEELRRRWRHFQGAAAHRPKGTMNRAMTALETRTLDRYSDDLTLLAGRGYLELVVDREKEFEEIFRIFEGERKGVLLVGPHGVGKEAILNGIAQRMVEEVVPGVLSDRRMVSLSIPKLLAGGTASESHDRLLHCLSDLARSGNIILALPHVHEAIGSKAGGLDMAEVLASELGKGYFLAVATTTPEEYRTKLEGTALADAFVKLELGEPDTSTAIQILESKAGAIEYRTKVYFSYNAIEKAVVLSGKYLKEQFLPEKAIDVLKEVAQYVRTHRGEKALVRGEDVAELISQKSHVPVTAVSATEADKLLHLEKTMHERIIGQDEAVRAIASALRRARAELREQKRPIASFLFLGPTGVGKTETAKTVAEVYFGNEEHMVRIDMSEYQDKGSVYRLLGAPGEHGGLLTEPVRKNAFSLILLDEIEKAHPDILNIFLQVIDDGRVTDSAGRVIDFTNTIIIATSNAGTQFIQEAMKQGNKGTMSSAEIMEKIKRELMEKELKQYFKPEFLNRFDGIVLYKPLTEPDIVSIAKLVLAKVGKQLTAKGITFRATDEAVVELAHAGFDPLFGARPLRRVIQERVQDALANLLLTSKISRRDVVVLEKGGQLRVEKAEKL